MATFCVGQRVRLARPFLSGNEGQVGTFMGYHKCLFAGRNCRVRWDSHGDDLYHQHTDQLEPIQPERNQTIPWSECLWMPPHMKETA